MDNETILAHEVEIALSETSISTVTAVITADNWTQWTTPDDSIIRFFENSSATSSSSGSGIGTTLSSAVATTNSTTQDFVHAISVWNIFEEIPWLLWVVIGAGVSLIVVVVVTIITCIAWSKKKKSRRRSASDQRIVGSSDSLPQFMWPRWMICCPKSVFERQEDLRRMRQNSASNLDPYRRPPLPPINPKDISEDGFHGNFLPPRRLEPVKTTTESPLTALAEKAENTSMLADTRDRDDSDLFGINITGIRGVPVMPVENGRRRPLPVPPSDSFNHL